MKEKQRQKPSKSVGGIYLIFSIKVLVRLVVQEDSHSQIYFPVL